MNESSMERARVGKTVDRIASDWCREKKEKARD